MYTKKYIPLELLWRRGIFIQRESIIQIFLTVNGYFSLECKTKSQKQQCIIGSITLNEKSLFLLINPC